MHEADMWSDHALQVLKWPLTVSLLTRASSSCWKPPPMGPCAGVATATAMPFADSSNTRGRGAERTVFVVVSMAAPSEASSESTRASLIDCGVSQR